MRRPPRPIDHLVGLLLSIAYFTLLFATAGDLGMSRDESFYVKAAEDYGAWYALVFQGDPSAFELEVIDRYWRYNSEHPAFVKTLFAWSVLANEQFELFDHPSTAHRVPAMGLAALLVWLIYIFGARVFGRQAGLFAALSFALMPRVFYHAHLNCFDIPITFAVTLVAYLYYRSLEQKRFAIGTGLAFGIALATKHNSWVLPGVFGIHFLWLCAEERGSRLRGETPQITMKPYWLLAMIALGPLLFWGSWPWLWHDTLQRLNSYALFHLRHDFYNIAYFGDTYFRPPFPIELPLVLTAFTVPASVLALAIVGLGLRFPFFLPRFMLRRYAPRLAPSVLPNRTDVLLLGLLLSPILIIALPSSPIFGGTKHWMPAYPFLAMFAGFGFTRMHAAISRSLHSTRTWKSLYAIGIGAFMLAPSALETRHSHPFGLSHYTQLAGGVPGAADLGMNRQFWGFTTRSMVSWLNETLPQGGSVYVCDTTFGAWRMLQSDGHLAGNIRPTGDMIRADIALVHHERHFAEVDYQAWVAYGSPKPMFVLTYDGVPLVTAYQNPKSVRVRSSSLEKQRRQAP
ncbi:MAG: glycosyltransferase family 39 protein [Myxococcota bacterium]